MDQDLSAQVTASMDVNFNTLSIVSIVVMIVAVIFYLWGRKRYPKTAILVWLYALIMTALYGGLQLFTYFQTRDYDSAVGSLASLSFTLLLVIVSACDYRAEARKMHDA